MSVRLPKAQTHADVVIIGGGVIGLSIARVLALRGLDSVTVIDRGEFGKEASWAAGGILAPQIEADAPDDFFRFACASRDLYPAFVGALESETGIKVEFDQTGTLYVGFNEGDENEMRRRFEWQTNAGLRVEWLSGNEARRLESFVSPEAPCALRFPDDWQVENRKLIEALVASNNRLGVNLLAHCGANSLQTEHDRVTGIDTPKGFIGANKVVMAAGAWTSHVHASTDFDRPQIEPVRGQMLTFKSNTPFARHVIYSSRGYLVPRRDGRVLAGSTSERAGFDKQVTRAGAESIKSMAFEIAPGLASLTIVDSWAGFRPHAPDDLPILGASADFEGLFYATGHYRNGILLAPITAKLIADIMVSGLSSEWLEVFSPNRFRLAPVG